EAVMTRIQSDVVELLVACARGELKNKRLSFDPDAAVTVMLVSGGYPGEYQKDKPMAGLNQPTGALIFHAGTRQSGSQTVTDGGRVLAVTGRGKTLTEAKKSAYQSISGISWEDMYFRRDIGLDLLQERPIG